MNIRRLGAEDVETFKSLRLRSMQIDPEAFASDHDDWAAFPESRWLAFLEEPIFAAFERQEAIGLIGLVPQHRARQAHWTIIGMFWIDPQHRGGGVAAALIETAIAHARAMGCNQVELSVNADNARAVRFYRRHGFSEFGLRPRGYRTPDGYADDLLMVRKLNG